MIQDEAKHATAVSAAKELFWARGYDEASIDDVVKATGLNRYAIYSAFGGKRDLFLATLQAYHEERRSVFLRHFDDPARPPLDAVRKVAEFCIAEMTERRTGCLVCNLAMDVGRDDPVVAERVDAYLQEINSAFTAALARAAERGELNDTVSPAEAAQVLVALILGVGALARAGASREALQSTFLAAVDGLCAKPGAAPARPAAPPIEINDNDVCGRRARAEPRRDETE
ncbi:MAG: TetR/AcrR family transcriptional regulator [Parvularculaceae bacterium]